MSTWIKGGYDQGIFFRGHLLLIALLFVGMSVSCASDKASKPAQSRKAKTADEIMADLAPRLKLTEEQKVKVQPIIQSFCDKRDELRQKGRQGGSSIKDDMTSLYKDTERLVSVVLTDEQFKEYQKYQSEERQKMEEARQSQGGRGGRGGGMRGGGMGGGFGR